MSRIPAKFHGFCRLLFAFDALPVSFGGLFGLIVAKMVIGAALQAVRQVLLLHPVILKIVGVLVVLPLHGGVLAVVVLVLQLTGHGAAVAAADVL